MKEIVINNHSLDAKSLKQLLDELDIFLVYPRVRDSAEMLADEGRLTFQPRDNGTLAEIILENPEFWRSQLESDIRQANGIRVSLEEGYTFLPL